MVIAFIGLLIVDPSNPTPSYTVLALLFFITIIIIIVIWCKYPKFKDRYWIRHELKEQIFFSIFVMLFGVSMLVWINRIGIEGIRTFAHYTGVILCDGLCFILIVRVVHWNTCSTDKDIDEEKLSQCWNEYNKYQLEHILNRQHEYEEHES